MAENPEALNSLVNQQSGNDDAADALRTQIRVHEQTNNNKTALDKMVEFVWHGDDKSLADLKSLQVKVSDDVQKGDTSALAGLSDEIQTKVQADQSAMKTQNSVEFYSGSFLKAVPLFAGKNKLLMAASIGFNALDAVHAKDQGNQVYADLALGGLKGFALKYTFDSLGSKQLSLGPEGSTLSKVSSIGGVGVKGMAIGSLSRFYDTGLNEQNLFDKSGNMHPLDAVHKAAVAAFDGRSMAMDAALFMTAHGAFTGLAKVGAAAIEASPMLQKVESSAIGNFVKDSKMIPGSTMGATFGFSSGAVGEFSRERQSGEDLDFSKIVKRGAFQALTDASAGAVGAGATRMSELQQQALASDKSAPARPGRVGAMGLAFAGENSEAPPPPPPPEEAATGSLHVEHQEVQAPATAPAPESGEGAIDPHKLDAALQPIFDHSVALATKAVQPDTNTEDVINFFKYAAGDGQHVSANMQDVAHQANQYGNTAMEALIKQAYATNPETAAILDTGLNLAETSIRHGATPEQDLAFLEWAYGPGRAAEIPLRMAAELSGNTILDKHVQEAYAGANGLQRPATKIQPLNFGDIPREHAQALMTVLSNLPEEGLGHQLFRQNLQSFARVGPQYEAVVKDYAQQTRYGVVAAVADNIFGTDYLSRFPERSLTKPDLLDKLKGLDHHNSFAPSTVGDAPGDVLDPNNGATHSDQPAPVEQQAVPAPNPYRPAIERIDGKTIVNAESLLHEFETTEGRAKQARAYFLTDFVGKMTDQQFVDWYANGLQAANRPDLPEGTTNFDLMHVPGLDVLRRPEVINAFIKPDEAAIDFRTLKDFLSAPERNNANPPLWQTEFIKDRIAIAEVDAMRRAGETPTEPGVEPQPVDPGKIVKDAVPGWFLKSIRDRASTYNRNDGTAIYPVHFDDDLAQMLENQRVIERQNPRFKESTPPSNSFADRISTLEKALDLQKTGVDPALIQRILELGTTNQPVVRGILEKLNPETSAPEQTELLKIVAPRAKSIDDIKTLEDAMYFGSKADSAAFKNRKSGAPSAGPERDAANNMALALTVAHQIVPPSDPAAKRMEQIITGVIKNTIRDPRPDDFGGPPGKGGGFGNKGGGRGGDRDKGAAGGREFRQRPNPPNDDRPASQEPVKTVRPVSVAQVEQQQQQVIEAQPQQALEAQPQQVLEAQPQQVLEPQQVIEAQPQQVLEPQQVIEAQPHQVQQGLFDQPVSSEAVVHPAPAIHTASEAPDNLERATAGDGAVVVAENLLSSGPGHLDMTPVVDGDGHITDTHESIKPAVTFVQQPEDTSENQGRSRRGGHQDDDERPIGKPGKPKGKAHQRGGHRERGGANAQRYQRGFEDDE